MSAPDVYVVLKDGDSHGTRDGTPLCVELDERTARYRKVGRCVRYVPAPDVEVRTMPGGAFRLFVNGYGVATWPSGPASEAPEEYANEVARCVRKALSRT